jgi:hypothetical protein
VPASKRGPALLASEETKRQPGSTRGGAEPRQPRAGVDSRESGVGGSEAGAGAFSGGDIDTDITGVGFRGAGVSQSGPDDPRTLGAADASGGGADDDFASGPPARGANPPARRPIKRGSTVDHSGGDATTTDTGAAGTVGFTQPDDTGAGRAPSDDPNEDVESA